MEFREILGQLRREQGLNQEQLAEKIGVSRQAVSKWETGEASPDLPNLLALADALDVSLDVLCGRAERDAVSPPPVEKAPASKKKRWWIGALIAAIVIGMLLPILLGVVNYVRIETAPSETVNEIDDPYIVLDTQNYLGLVESLSRAEFMLSDGGLLTCRVFCGAENTGAFRYSFQFLDLENNVYAITAGYRDGTIIGESFLSLTNCPGTSTVCLRVWDDERGEAFSVLIPLAANVDLNYSNNSVTWKPLH